MTARTLRYYDQIGLLRPARVGPNGYRYYERPQMVRLQEVLLLRDLGLDLATIGAVIDAGAAGSYLPKVRPSIVTATTYWHHLAAAKAENAVNFCQPAINFCHRN